MDEKSEKKLTTWGQLRFSIIGGLLARPPEKGKLGKELEILASRCYRHPTKDEWVTFSVSTIERWYYQALRAIDPVGTLSRKIRSDAGETKAMDTALLAALGEQYPPFLPQGQDDTQTFQEMMQTHHDASAGSKK